MIEQNPKRPHADAEGSTESAASMPSRAPSAEEPGAVSGPAHQSQAGIERVDAKKLQQAIENLVGRIAAARSRGAARARAETADAHDRARSDDMPIGARADAMPGGPRDESADRSFARSDRHLAALELRMRQIAELAGAPFAEDISADIAALRGTMDRMSQTDGVLSSRMETVQRQISHLRESFDTSSAPVVDRLMELETRLDDIGEALANRRLSVEARSAVEHSCGHILGAIARIEGLARQAVPPAGMWDQIAAVHDRIERSPTIDDIAGLEKRVHEVSEQVGKVAERSDRSQDMANLESHLAEIGAATRAAVEEIRERPAYDPTDVHALMQRIETWRGETPASGLPDVDVKLDAIARQVDRLSQSDQTAAVAKIEEGLGELIGIVSAQNANLSGLDLAGLQNRLATICDRLLSHTSSSITDGFGHSREDAEDQELAKQLAVRFAPESTPRRSPQSDAGPDTDEVSGAFDALQEALEGLLGQVPFLERSEGSGGQSPAPEGGRAAASATTAPEWQASGGPARLEADSGNDEGRPHALAAVQPADPPSEIANSEGSAAPSAAEPGGLGAKPVPSTQGSPPTEKPSAYADATHRIGSYSTWRKAKVAVVAASTPKY